MNYTHPESCNVTQVIAAVTWSFSYTCMFLQLQCSCACIGVYVLVQALRSEDNNTWYFIGKTCYLSELKTLLGMPLHLTIFFLGFVHFSIKGFWAKTNLIQIFIVKITSSNIDYIIWCTIAQRQSGWLTVEAYLKTTCQIYGNIGQKWIIQVVDIYMCSFCEILDT